MKKIPLHIQIIIGLVSGLVLGIGLIFFNVSPSFTIDYIKPIGTIFVSGLKMIAVPLVLASLVVGVASLGDVSKLSRMGGKTIMIYVLTTIIAITVGLTIVNLIDPGHMISDESRAELFDLYKDNAQTNVDVAEQVKERSPLEPLIQMVPSNIFESTADNSKMLQVVFFAILMGVALLQIPKDKSKPVIAFFEGLNAVILQIINYIMMIAPYGVFALITSIIVELAGDNPEKAYEILSALFMYAVSVILGLGIMIFLVYPGILKFFTKFSYRAFFKGIRPAQLLAFSTSSSSATLPVTMKCVEKNLKVPEEVSSFVLPLGATINMDGTSLYQGVAAVFIAQALGMDLTLSQQLMIVFTATLASIGTAGVPGAGMVMLVIVMESVGIPAAGLALIIAPDRILDMCRTVVNVTGDATVTMLIHNSEQAAVEEKKIESVSTKVSI